jgi:hypothetical protein
VRGRERHNKKTEYIYLLKPEFVEMLKPDEEEAEEEEINENIEQPLANPADLSSPAGLQDNRKT